MNILLSFLSLLIDFFKSSLSFVKICIVSKPITALPKANTDTCVLLGNGPSFNDSIKKYNDKIQALDSMCVNYFGITEYFGIIKPRYYILNSRDFFIPKVSEYFFESRQVLFKSIVEKTTWKMFLIIPAQIRRHKEWINYVSTNKNIVIQFYNQTPIEGLKSFSFFLFNIRVGMPRPHNILIPSLMAAIGMKYKNVFILGADHSWLKEISVDESNVVLINQKHFYDENSSKPLTMKRGDNADRRIHEVLEKFVLTFRGYHIIEEYSKRKGTKIYNSTPNSFIDAFERKEL